MEHIIEMTYDTASKKTTISSEGVIFDTERLNGVEISKWVYPFHVHGVRWYGLYEELKSVYLHSTYTIVFDGTTEDYEILKNAMKDKHIEVKEKVSKVIILYDDSQFMTKITINGKIFDTQRIEKRSIDEWVKPFSFKAADWQGIFGEISNYLGNDFYSISFVGNTEDMKILMDNAPDNINIYYKPKVTSANKSKPKQTATEDSSQILNKSSQPSEPIQFTKPNLNDIKGGFGGFIAGAKVDYDEMTEKESGILMFGKISVIIAVLCTILFTIFMSRLLMLLSIIPAIVFGILAFTKGYKKLAVCTIAICVILAVLSWTIITIRWRMTFKDIDDAFDDLNDSFDDVNDAFGQINDAMAGN